MKVSINIWYTSLESLMLSFFQSTILSKEITSHIVLDNWQKNTRFLIFLWMSSLKHQYLQTYWYKILLCSINHFTLQTFYLLFVSGLESRGGKIRMIKQSFKCNKFWPDIGLWSWNMSYSSTSEFILNWLIQFDMKSEVPHIFKLWKYLWLNWY